MFYLLAIMLFMAILAMVALKHLRDQERSRRHALAPVRAKQKFMLLRD